MGREFDYVIVGGGSAGCVLANRLSADASVSVLLLEAGGPGRNLFIDMPSAFAIPMASKQFNWGYYSAPEPYLDNRRIDCARGRGLGGSSAINGMVYVRGHARDFDEWESLGADGWSYRHCLPYFQRAETWMHGGDDYRGGSGPLRTNNGNNRKNPLYDAFIEAGREAGYGLTDDYNGHRQEGFGTMHMTVGNGLRWSTRRGYLQPVMRRTNLTVLTGAHADRVEFDERRAVAIHYHQRGMSFVARARREIVLSAGSIGSPSILQRSGVGDASVLNEAGIEPRFELPGVGANLSDHLEVYFQYRCKQPITINGKLDPISKAMIGAQWLLTKTGLGASNHFESCGFIRSQAGVESPDIQYHFLPAAVRYDGNAAFDGHGFQVHVGPNKPESRGHVRVTDRHVDAEPEILFNYLSTEKDRNDWRLCLRLTREILGQPALDSYRGDEIQPAVDLDDNEAVDRWVRENVETAYHPSCSCKMGASDDDMAVVDSECRVQGVEGLRVIDSSIFPSIPNGNLNAPTIMVAERGAALIRGEAMLESDATPWICPNWQTRQRESAPIRPLVTGRHETVDLEGFAS